MISLMYYRLKTSLFIVLITSCLFSSQLMGLNPAWPLSEFVWAPALYALTDVGFHFDPLFYPLNYWRLPFFIQAYAHIKAGDLVYVHARHVGLFCKYVLPQVEVPFILVVCSDCDESFPSDVLGNEDINSLIENKQVIHVFAWNCDYQGNSQKFSPLPLGIDLTSRTFPLDSPLSIPITIQEEELKEILSTLQPTHLRKKASFVDFQFNDTMARAEGSCAKLYKGENRTSIFELLSQSGCIDYGSYMPPVELWKKKGEYAFCISPHGHGMDCMRTWEGLVLGCIVIVKKSPLDPLYEGLPVVIVEDWKEVTQENLDKWLVRYSDAFTNPQYRVKLTNTYWLDKMRALAKRPLL